MRRTVFRGVFTGIRRGLDERSRRPASPDSLNRRSHL